VVHDWLVTWRGGENVLAEILKLLPDAELYALVDFLPDAQRAHIAGRRAHTSFLQHMPFARTHFRAFLPLFPRAIEAIDLGLYDRIVSVSHAVAKNVRVRARQQHLCYCLTPMRYAWDMRGPYLASVGAEHGVRRWAATRLLDRLKAWDRKSSARITRFAGISHYVADRIDRAYGRAAAVIYPPVDVDHFRPAHDAPAARDYYVTGGQWVAYKKVDAVVAAFAQLEDRRLVVIGEGPEAPRLRSAAGPNVEFVGTVDRDVLRRLLQNARAFVFAAEEDFGILPVEAQACGTPVIALSRGGTAETVVASGDDATGVLFDEQTPASIANAIIQFEQMAHRIEPDACRRRALDFSSARFRERFGAWLDEAPQPAPAAAT